MAALMEMASSALSDSAASPLYGIFTIGVGIAGNLLAFVLFLSPMPTFKRIVKNKATEQFSGLPCIYSLLNCLICAYYGLPIVSKGVILVCTVNTIGAIFQSVYAVVFIIYAENKKKKKMLGLLFGVIVLFALIVFVSLHLGDRETRRLFVGYLSVASLISMFASPLFIINLVIQTRSVEYMPFTLSLATFLMSICFFAYGLLEQDFFIYIPNGIGTVLGIVQLLLYSYFSKALREDSTPLLV